ncbi:hypothetical protein A3C59_05320 [Candidatus Daviesbacteria bacterium RIFCSPHIGHO2_02_FULL_36_13]|uniref:Uncharacterized protein n=1 Tax=Candidatus Daviesbacteria bacterium RIFCSPHIGHO2_02_FULL_36_13 TaxID=1797768 RepID=A0A1F5JSG4_9BACT|nr:MAG: hypothetical protein A3C59_05320 [Candidatus Daviesbacteria bacterium RIFCSPHIGHO2_02_FULL_36_13]
MIKPSKYTDINLSIFSVSFSIVSLLKVNRVLKYDELLDKVLLVKGERAKEMFLPSLNFLFSLGKVEYYSELDIFELNL